MERSLLVHLELLRQVKGNSVVLLCSLKLLVWLDESDHRCGHANLLVVNIVARNVLIQSLHSTQLVSAPSSYPRRATGTAEHTAKALVMATSKFDPSIVVPTNLAAMRAARVTRAPDAERYKWV